jgi:hypothetical protein
MKKVKSVLFFLIVIYMFSCGAVIKCPNEDIIPVLKGYSLQQADTIIVKNYKKGSNFTILTDSIVAHYSHSVITPTDTTYYFWHTYIDGKSDVRIINPYDNKTKSVSDIKHEVLEVKKSACSKIECTSPVISYIRDGVLQTKGNSQKFNEVIIAR